MARALRAALSPALAVAFLSAAVFLPVLNYPFLNWDDYDVFARNEGLRGPGVIPWAFSTRYMEHYQPLSWLAWAGIDRVAGLTSVAAHAVNVVLHGACAALVYALARSILGGGPGATLPAVLAALVWAIHPLRVEAVAWASAMPYPLALLFALVAALAWMESYSWTAATLLGASLFARPVALAAPVVFWLIKRPSTRRAGAALAFMIVCAAATGAIESSARLTASLTDFGVGARVTLAASAPWIYLSRTILPVDLTALDPLALAPHTDLRAIVLGLAGIMLVSAAAWRWRRGQPVLACAWASYLLLLLPAAGLLPSGLQATADRYTYLPAAAISIVLAHVMATVRSERASALATVSAFVMVVTFGVLAWRQTAHWRDSISLWTHAVVVNPRNDIALYNLGSALGEAGRRTEAIERYEQVLALVPGHTAARHNRDLLVAERLEAEGNERAARGDLNAAVDRYARAVTLDPARTHSHSALGIALIELGREREAREPLQTAVNQGTTDPAVANALAYVLAKSGEQDRAIAILREAQRRHPEDANIRRNLATLLAAGGRR